MFYLFSYSMKKIIISTLIISSVFLLSWCGQKLHIGEKVMVSYTGHFEDGTFFETQTKTITIWSWEIIKWLEEALIKKGYKDEFTVTITPENGFGDQYSINNQQRISAIILEKLWLPTDTGSLITLDKITGKILKQTHDEDGNTIIILDINPRETQENIIYKVHTEKIETSSTWYTL